ncbi:Zn-ribbon domain-containing OB-fold protein [Hoyosella subflava]|uniref:DNA-binding protein n=1 Tax=Hoyosella subflava (strain DSM 45089 / JCM 17490 / NBRC 109087 / DQS3-9A1) TaxID=443218 RepID=F6EPK5_HOYSD|nr:OB-fold nucleic acid binding domain-containing protein [Hoyosella subflava]AEF39438.1 hypothetical protein AS9A_0986 [Hoyosella subflava DQS3-9A1]
MTTDVAPLSAPLNIGFDYTRSLGPVLSRFMTALAQRQILGIKGSDGRVHVPPVEYDPVTAEPLTEFVEVGTEGTVLTWSWCPKPVEGQPIQQPFAWALIRLDGADAGLLHAVNVPSPSDIRTGMRVQVQWAEAPTGHIRDIAYFVPTDPGTSAAAPQAPPPPESKRDDEDRVTTIITPIQLAYDHTVSAEESRYLRALADGKLIGQRCAECGQVYIPPRGACPVDGVPTTTEVELPDTGIVTTFCIVNVPFLGQRITPPYVVAYVLLDGADIAFLHLVRGCDSADVRMGMRVRAVWRPKAEWQTSLSNIDYFTPTGERDAPIETFARHL